MVNSSDIEDKEDKESKEIRKDILKYYKKVKKCIKPSCGRLYGTDSRYKSETEFCPICDQKAKGAESIFTKMYHNSVKRNKLEKEYMDSISYSDKVLWGLNVERPFNHSNTETKHLNTY